MSNKPKKSSTRHTRAIQRDQSKHQTSGPPAEAIEQRLEALIHPAMDSPIALFQSMGLRARIWTLPVLMAFVVSLIWRQIGAVGEAVRVLNQAGMLWVSATPVSQAGVTQRLNSLPAGLFENVLKALLPKMATEWGTRQRPLPAAVAFVQQRFSQVLVLDGSTLDALLRKRGLLQAAATHALAGRIAAVLDVVRRLPVQLWYEPDEQAHDHRFWLGVLSRLVANCPLLFDRGFLNFEVFDQLTRHHRWFIRRPQSHTVDKVTSVLRQSAAVHDYRLELGAVGKHCQEPRRLVACLWQGVSLFDPCHRPASPPARSHLVPIGPALAH